MNYSEQQKKLAEIARDFAATTAISTKDAFEMLMRDVLLTESRLQKMIDSLVAIQNEWPMPEAGWKQFVEDIEHTNKKHDFNLIIRDPDK